MPITDKMIILALVERCVLAKLKIVNTIQANIV